VNRHKHFFPTGPSFEGIAFVSWTIMTGKPILRNSKIDIPACFVQKSATQ
jgi:hypothetical protein